MRTPTRVMLSGRLCENSVHGSTGLTTNGRQSLNSVIYPFALSFVEGLLRVFTPLVVRITLDGRRQVNLGYQSQSRRDFERQLLSRGFVIGVDASCFGPFLGWCDDPRARGESHRADIERVGIHDHRASAIGFDR